MADLPIEPTPINDARRVLTPVEMNAIWKGDEFWGKAGSYDTDPFTGKRTLRED